MSDREHGVDCVPDQRALTVSTSTLEEVARILAQHQVDQPGAAFRFLLVAVPLCEHGHMHLGLPMRNTVVATNCLSPFEVHGVLDAFHRRYAYLGPGDLFDIEQQQREGH